MAPAAIITADWLTRPSTQAVFVALERAGLEGRVVGGAVRNTLLGRPVTDIDIATPAVPEDVMAAARAAGLGVVPTGLKHGTVTVISDGVPHEVTTLRHDLETDGRHAVVAFSADWTEDAARRDFTINALYCDRRGEVFDPLGGYDDLRDRRVRFIGDADARIREDYLRILRFFRFSAEYALGSFDAAGLQAAGRLREGLRGLSSERVRAELVKMLVAPRASEAVHTMVAHGFLSPLLGLAVYPSLMQRAIQTEIDTRSSPNPMFRLGLLAVSVAENAHWLAKHLRLSGDERDDLLAVAAGRSGPGASDPPGARAQIYRRGERWHRLQMLSAAARAPADQARHILQLVEATAAWQVPAMPVSGRDLISLGFASGPEMGEAIRYMEASWIASDFTAEKAALIRLVADRVR